MSEHKRAPVPGEDPKTAGNVAPEAGQTAEAEALAEADAQVAGEAAHFEAEKARLGAEIANMKDKYLRAFAEAENIRRRAEREVADAKTYGVTSFARDMLTVGDDLSRAMSHLGDEVKAEGEGPLKGLVEGLELTEKALHKALEKHGIRKIDPRGEKFDPNLHQAMFEVPDPSVPSGTVVQVVQSGYVIGERVLRPAMVGVARGGPKAGAATEESKADKN